MNYWLLRQAKEGFQVFAETTEINYKDKKTTVSATGKNGKAQGSIKDDYPLFLSLNEPVFSERLIKVISSLNCESTSIRQVSLELSNGKINHNWYEVVVSAYVNCIDYQLSVLELDEDGSVLRSKKLVLNKKQAQQAGYDIFRLHDDFPTIIVSDRFKDAVEAITPTGIRFIPTDGSEY